MVVVPLSQPDREPDTGMHVSNTGSTNWAQMAAAGSLVASGILLLTGRRKAGLVTAAAGTALALLDQQDTVRAWWNSLPGHIEDVQRLLGKVQESVGELSVQRDRLHNILKR